MLINRINTEYLTRAVSLISAKKPAFIRSLMEVSWTASAVSWAAALWVVPEAP